MKTQTCTNCQTERNFTAKELRLRLPWGWDCKNCKAINNVVLGAKK